MAKVYERIVYDQLYFLRREEIISTYQSGFRSSHLTVTALLEATDNWAFNIDRGNVNAVVFLDLRASLCKILISSFAHKMDFAHNFSVDFF